MEIIIITGNRGEGKTTYLKKFIEMPHFDRNKMFGFYTKNKGSEDEYVLCNVKTKEQKILCKRNNPETGNLKFLDFWFDEEAIETGEKWLYSGFQYNDSAFVIDEVGKFELEGFVWNNVFEELLRLSKGKLIITVRKKFLDKVIEKYNLNNEANRLSIIEL